MAPQIIRSTLTDKELSDIRRELRLEREERRQRYQSFGTTAQETHTPTKTTGLRHLFVIIRRYFP